MPLVFPSHPLSGLRGLLHALRPLRAESRGTKVDILPEDGESEKYSEHNQNFQTHIKTQTDFQFYFLTEKASIPHNLKYYYQIVPHIKNSCLYLFTMALIGTAGHGLHMAIYSFSLYDKLPIIIEVSPFQ